MQLACPEIGFDTLFFELYGVFPIVCLGLRHLGAEQFGHEDVWARNAFVSKRVFINFLLAYFEE